VCDDREQLVAVFEEQPRSGLPGDHLGDGMSSEDSADCKEHRSQAAATSGSSGFENALGMQVKMSSCVTASLL
jgi:hypothetical protein